MFPEESGIISTKQIKIFQTIKPNQALAHTDNDKDIVLLTNETGISYYDDLVIKIPANKQVGIIGTYQYSTKAGFRKTVPVVHIK